MPTNQVTIKYTNSNTSDWNGTGTFPSGTGDWPNNNPSVWYPVIKNPCGEPSQWIYEGNFHTDEEVQILNVLVADLRHTIEDLEKRLKNMQEQINSGVLEVKKIIVADDKGKAITLSKEELEEILLARRNKFKSFLM